MRKRVLRVSSCCGLFSGKFHSDSSSCSGGDRVMDHFYQKLDFPELAQRPFIACNMVTSLDGKVTADGNQPASLGSSFDLGTMGVVRSHFDAVLAGGNTIRLHPYYLGVPTRFEEARKKKGLASQPLTVLLTRSGNLDPKSPLFTRAPPRPPIIITSSAGAQRLPSAIQQQSSVEIMENPNPQAIAELLQETYQVRRLLVEGGPSVNYQFMEAKILDELFLTLHPSLIGKRTDLGLSTGDHVLDQAEQIRLVSVNQHGDELFLRYQITW